MPSALRLRREIESALAHRMPGALTPRPRVIRDLAATGLPALDATLGGGLPVGAITELVGPPCSGRSTVALGLCAELTSVGKAVAWIDVDDALDPASAAAAGVDLERQLWVRCGGKRPQDAFVAPADEQGGGASASLTNSSPSQRPGPPLLVEGSRIPASSGGCGSPHPRGEARGLSQAIDALLQPGDTFARAMAPRGPDPDRPNNPNARKNRMVGTPSAPNRPLLNEPSQAFPQRSPNREEQTATDRLPPRRGDNLTAPPRRPKNLSAAQIAFTGQVAGTWTDNRNNAAGRCLQSSPNAIAAGLPRFQEMEARASGQGHGHERGPFTWKPSLANLGAPQPKPASTPGSRPAAPGEAPGGIPAIPFLNKGTPRTAKRRSGASLAGERPPGLGKATSPVWKALDQALRSADLLLAAGGFSAVVLDLGSIAPEFAWRIPLATWFRFRAAAERARTVFVLLTQHPCARSSAELVLRLSPVQPEVTGTVLLGAGLHITVERQRFAPLAQEVPPAVTSGSPKPDTLHIVSARKPPESERSAHWQRQTSWAQGTKTAGNRP